MFCKRCGADIREDNFCQFCGANAREDEKVINSVERKEYVKSNLVMKNMFSKKNMTIMGIAIVVLLFGAILIKSHKTSLTLNEYISVEFSGYDTLGKAEVSFNYDLFEEDYGKKIHFNKRALKKYLKENGEEWSNREVKEYIEENNACEILYKNCIYGSLDADTLLKNGENVIYAWECEDQDALTYFDVKLEYSEMEFIVEGLKKVEFFNPFENVTIEYSNIAPHGIAHAYKNVEEEMYEDISFSIEPSKELSNGDEVILFVELETSEESFVRKYGMKPEETQKVITVEGLEEYITSSEDITADDMKQLKEHSQGVIETLVNEECEDNNMNSNIKGSVEAITLEDTYFLFKKPTSEYEGENIFYFVYRVDIEEELTLSKTENKEFHTLSYYIAVNYCDLLNDSDGNMMVDLSDYTISKQKYVYDTGLTYSAFKLPLKFEYTGYDSLELFVEKNIENKLSNYTCEK